MRLTKEGTLKLIGLVLTAIGIAVFVIQQYLVDYRPELAQNSLYIIAFTLLIFALAISAVANELIKHKKSKA
jgi:hypothetical protein